MRSIHNFRRDVGIRDHRFVCDRLGRAKSRRCFRNLRRDKIRCLDLRWRRLFRRKCRSLIRVNNAGIYSGLIDRFVFIGEPLGGLLCCLSLRVRPPRPGRRAFWVSNSFALDRLNGRASARFLRRRCDINAGSGIGRCSIFGSLSPFTRAPAFQGGTSNTASDAAHPTAS